MASDGNGGGGDSSQFLTSGSSALILAFLAIGLFVGGLLVMFAMRRYVVLSRRRAGAWEGAAGSGPWNWEETTYEPLFAIAVGRGLRGRQEGPGATPELLDVRAVKAAGDDWEDIMPISVKEETQEMSPVPEVPATPQPGPEARDAPVQETPAPASSGFLHLFSNGVHNIVSQIRPSRRRAHSPSPRPSSPPPSDPALSPSVPAPPEPSPRYLRVALAIAMPTQQPGASAVPQYALGICDVKWAGEVSEDLQQGVGEVVPRAIDSEG